MLLRTSLLLLALLSYASPALAAWGENWAVMVWGMAAPSAVPMMDGIGLGLLLLVLMGLAIRSPRSSATLGLMVIASVTSCAGGDGTLPASTEWSAEEEAFNAPSTFGAADLAEAQGITGPHTFTNREVADAAQVNDNFDGLKTPVDTFATDLAAATSATFAAFHNGSSQDVASVGITTDNTAAGSAACTQTEGTRDAKTSICAATYDCLTSGICSQAVIQFPPAVYGFSDIREAYNLEECANAPVSSWHKHLVPSRRFFMVHCEYHGMGRNFLEDLPEMLRTGLADSACAKSSV